MCDILNRQDEYIAFLLSLTSMWGQSFAHPVFSLNPCVRGFIFDAVSKISEYIRPSKQVQTFTLSSPSGREAVRAGSCAAAFYTLRQLSSGSMTQWKGTSQPPAAPVCWDPSERMAACAHMCRHIKCKHEPSSFSHVCYSFPCLRGASRSPPPS